MRRGLALAAVAGLLAGCGGSSKRATTTASTSTATRTSTSVPFSDNVRTTPLSASLRLISPAFHNGGRIPRLYTCDGRNLSLPLSWTGVPKRARELLLEIRDPTAPTGNFVHWAVADIPPAGANVPAGSVPAGGVQGRNSFGTIGYRGPCPPHGDRPHTYVITLSALAGRSGVPTGFAPDQAVRSIEVGVATLNGTYRR